MKLPILSVCGHLREQLKFSEFQIDTLNSNANTAAQTVELSSSWLWHFFLINSNIIDGVRSEYLNQFYRTSLTPQKYNLRRLEYYRIGIFSSLTY